MASKNHIEDPETGSINLTHVGALVQIWENKTKQGLSLTFAEWVAKDDFVETTERDIGALKKEVAAARAGAVTSEEDVVALRKKLVGAREEDIAALLKEVTGAREEGIAALREELVGAREEDNALLRKELAETKEELAEGKKDICRLLESNKDLHEKYDELKKALNAGVVTPVSTSAADSLNDIKRVLCKFNKENPVAVANGDPRGVKFEKYVSITCAESLSVFLATVHARTLGLPSNILKKFQVFVLEGKLVTLSDDYRDGVGFSFLWKKKKSLKSVAVGWKTSLAKKYDPRLGIDPVTGVNYIDPATGNMWVPGVPERVVSTEEKQKQKKKKKKKRSLEKLSSQSHLQSQSQSQSQPAKKIRWGASSGDEEGEVFI